MRPAAKGRGVGWGWAQNLKCVLYEKKQPVIVEEETVVLQTLAKLTRLLRTWSRRDREKKPPPPPLFSHSTHAHTLTRAVATQKHRNERGRRMLIAITQLLHVILVWGPIFKYQPIRLRGKILQMTLSTTPMCVFVLHTFYIQTFFIISTAVNISLSHLLK